VEDNGLVSRGLVLEDRPRSNDELVRMGLRFGGWLKIFV